MDYYTTLLPLFSYMAHLTAPSSGVAGQIVASVAVQHDLRCLIEKTCPLLPPGGEDAWFALSAWMAEKLSGSPEYSALAQTALPGVGDWESGFYQRLNRLLHRRDDPATIKVYSLCLDLGFRGYYARPGFEHHLDGYRNRCREILAADGVGGALDAIQPPRPSRMRSLAVAAVTWTAPAAITILLYALYRLLLSDLYSTILD